MPSLNRPVVAAALALLCVPFLLPARAQTGRQQDDEAQRAQRRLELRHAVESQRLGIPPDAQGRSLTPEQRTQLREDVRKQYGSFGARADAPPEPGSGGQRPPAMGGGPRP